MTVLFPGALANMAIASQKYRTGVYTDALMRIVAGFHETDGVS